MKKILFCFGLLCLIFMLGGCSSTDPNTIQGRVEIEDSNHRIVTIKNTPQRIVTLSPSFVELVEALDGKLVGTASSNLVKTNPKLDKVGFSFNVNTEKILSLQPDLVIGYQGMHERYLPFFEEMNIPVIMLKLKTYKDVRSSIQLLGQALHNPKKAADVNKILSQEMSTAISPGQRIKPSIAIVHYSSQGIALESGHSIAGDTAKMLELHNVLMDAPQLTALQKENEFIPYNLEMLIQQNPEVIFVTSMGAQATVDEFINDEIIHNPSWSTVKAVQKQQVFPLPEELFLINPGLRYPQAVEYMAEKLATCSR